MATKPEIRIIDSDEAGSIDRTKYVATIKVEFGSCAEIPNGAFNTEVATRLSELAGNDEGPAAGLYRLIAEFLRINSGANGDLQFPGSVTLRVGRCAGCSALPGIRGHWVDDGSGHGILICAMC